MHSCLHMDEIVRLVAHELVTSDGVATSVALACCCKSLEEPVLDVLWETQEKLLPLLKTLPGDIWDEGGYAVSGPIAEIFSSLNRSIRKSFRRPPTTPEWSRFRKYARRMRELEERGDLGVISPEVLPVLQFYTINEPIFPHLKTLQLWFTPVEFIPTIPLLLSPSTTVIDISFFGFDPSKAMALSMVTTFPTLCPNLQEISLHCLPRDPMITASVSEMVLSINRHTLQKFHVDSPLTEEASEVVYKLPNLRGLSRGRLRHLRHHFRI